MIPSKSLSTVTRIAKFTLIDEVQQRSFVVMFVFCAICVFLVRGCYQGNYMVNGQTLDTVTIVQTLSKAAFHVIGTGVMVIAALLSMRAFRRDRNEGVQSSVLSKPIFRWQYVMGKVLGLWVLSAIFMFILHGIVFLITSINLKIFMPGYLTASLLCFLNLLFVVIAVLLLSLLMPDIIAFLSVLGVGIVGFVADGIVAASHNQIVQAIVQQQGGSSQSDLTWWKVVYILWPKVLGVQQLAASLIDFKSFNGFGSIYPLINIFGYCFIFGVLLFKRFRNEDIV